MAFLAVSPSSFTFFFRNSLHSEHEVDPGKHLGMSENNHAGGPNSHLGWKCYTEVNHIFLFDPA